MEFNDSTLIVRTHKTHARWRTVVFVSLLLFILLGLNFALRGGKSAVDTLSSIVLFMLMGGSFWAHVLRTTKPLHSVTHRGFESVNGQWFSWTDFQGVFPTAAMGLTVRFGGGRELEFPFGTVREADANVHRLHELEQSRRDESTSTEQSGCVEAEGPSGVASKPTTTIQQPMCHVTRTPRQSRHYQLAGISLLLGFLVLTAFACLRKARSPNDALFSFTLFSSFWCVSASAFQRLQGRYVRHVSVEGVVLCNGTKIPWSMVQRLEPLGVTPWLVMTDGQRVPISFDCPDNMGVAFALIRSRAAGSSQS